MTDIASDSVIELLLQAGIGTLALIVLLVFLGFWSRSLGRLVTANATLMQANAGLMAQILVFDSRLDKVEVAVSSAAVRMDNGHSALATQIQGVGQAVARVAASVVTGDNRNQARSDSAAQALADIAKSISKGLEGIQKSAKMNNHEIKLLLAELKRLLIEIQETSDEGAQNALSVARLFVETLQDKMEPHEPGENGNGPAEGATKAEPA
jgi:hypothetical protein